ncbi:MAG: hypothetical protein KF805_14845 [Phycisphaeraceae bacterium]|nr:hypothetical protein [Phycisphaeraceae bacterium]
MPHNLIPDALRGYARACLRDLRYATGAPHDEPRGATGVFNMAKKGKKKAKKKAARKTGKKKARRTVLYSSKGKKLYAVRDRTGKFKDIQQYSRAHAMDIKRKSKDE